MTWRHSSERESPGDANIALYVSSDCSLSVGCQDGDLKVLLHFGANSEPLVAAADVAVRHQVDDDAPTLGRWYAAPDGRGAFAADPLGFTRDLLHGDRLLLDVGEDGERRRLEIDLDGAAATIRPVLAGCGVR